MKMLNIIESHYATRSLTIINSVFSDNFGTTRGGIIYTTGSLVHIFGTNFINNSASLGGVLYSHADTIIVMSNSTFTSNSATIHGGVLYTYRGNNIIIHGNTFTNNSATDTGGAIWCSLGYLRITESSFNQNRANSYGGIMLIIDSTARIVDSIFDHNLGSLYSFNSQLNFSGHIRFEDCAEPSVKVGVELSNQEGGAITSYQSTVIFTNTGTPSRSPILKMDLLWIKRI